ncbi:hypothetical protein DACRYDRAFT_18524 [Dacryopinax primogenitus]|uniref:Uncharacterized protein n=1 Tax=Dacryopinax primogenitus (strain DJM 731) TaxID=1858805 RepID=M5FNI9_DACPD|nr:uncharacterized protein DACRYDRAFT_18524 [Dacryopinax primogenitus]EJT97525.1 hypothetical protein DACRYDRAFT_18524 [Dacryopinax primogenitus]
MVTPSAEELVTCSHKEGMLAKPYFSEVNQHLQFAFLPTLQSQLVTLGLPEIWVPQYHIKTGGNEQHLQCTWFQIDILDQMVTLYEHMQVLMCWQLYCQEKLFQNGLTYVTNENMTHKQRGSAMLDMYVTFEWCKFALGQLDLCVSIPWDGANDKNENTVWATYLPQITAQWAKRQTVLQWQAVLGMEHWTYGVTVTEHPSLPQAVEMAMEMDEAPVESGADPAIDVVMDGDQSFMVQTPFWCMKGSTTRALVELPPYDPEVMLPHSAPLTAAEKDQMAFNAYVHKLPVPWMDFIYAPVVPSRLDPWQLPPVPCTPPICVLEQDMKEFKPIHGGQSIKMDGHDIIWLGKSTNSWANNFILDGFSHLLQAGWPQDVLPPLITEQADITVWPASITMTFQALCHQDDNTITQGMMYMFKKHFCNMSNQSIQSYDWKLNDNWLAAKWVFYIFTPGHWFLGMINWSVAVVAVWDSWGVSLKQWYHTVQDGGQFDAAEVGLIAHKAGPPSSWHLWGGTLEGDKNHGSGMLPSDMPTFCQWLYDKVAELPNYNVKMVMQMGV